MFSSSSYAFSSSSLATSYFFPCKYFGLRDRQPCRVSHCLYHNSWHSSRWSKRTLELSLLRRRTLSWGECKTQTIDLWSLKEKLFSLVLSTFLQSLVNVRIHGFTLGFLVAWLSPNTIFDLELKAKNTPKCIVICRNDSRPI